MDHDQFVQLVARDAGIDRDAAERAIRATLTTLAERISRGEARDLAAQLPPALSPWLNADERSQRFDVDEFLRRVAERAGVDEDAAFHLARVVFAVLAQAIVPSEFDDVLSELPADYGVLLPRGRGVDVMPAQTFFERVRERGGLDDGDDARRATEAVLEALAERISGGEVDDLIARLAPALHAPLKRGRERSGGVARSMALERFVALIAERDGVAPPVAAEHARAVFATLREAVDDDEFFDVTVQLPQDYVSALVPART
jgi:uncharacterized protein (DUF2267 family)